jgi:PKHD-type hydroxylase
MLYPISTNGNAKITTTCAVSQFFKDEDIKKIMNRLDSNAWGDLGVYSEESSNNNAVDSSSRKGKGQLLAPNLQDAHPFPQLSQMIATINDSHWNFDIRYIDFINDSPAVFKYGVGGKHDWHFDSIPTQSTRKLSYTIQLSDSNEYEGGDLEFFDGGSNMTNPEFRQKGNIIVFPSYAWHHITPITKGIRYAMVGWIHGPTYR